MPARSASFLSPPPADIYTVSRLNREAREVLEGSFAPLWVEGEISNYIAHPSGHWYFSLKDAQAQIRCAYFRTYNRQLTFQPKNGMHVRVHGYISLYEGRGDFQLIVEQMEEAGEGKLRRAFEELKKRLAAAGLFEAAHKKLLPNIPTCIGIITSPTGAAVRDILSILNRRFPSIPVIIYPTIVQGETAAASISQALEIASRRQECDVLILTRGGGSLEDLWPFNEERVAHAIYQSTIPLISGIGHEIDFTIADFVADKRAPTPSGAAELVVPDQLEVLQNLQQEKRHLIKQISSKLALFKQQLGWVEKQLQQQHPQRKLKEKIQHLDICEATLIRLQNKMLQDRQAQLKTAYAQLLGLTPQHRIARQSQHLVLQQENLKTSIAKKLHHSQLSLTQLASKLDAISPLNTLKRGYAIVTDSREQHIVRSIYQIKLDEHIKLQLKDGKLTCRVEDIQISQA